MLSSSSSSSSLSRRRAPTSMSMTNTMLVWSVLFIVTTIVALLPERVHGARTIKYKIKGMAFTSGHNPEVYGTKKATQSLLKLRATGARWLHITAIHGMNDINSRTSYEITDEKSLILIIRKARRLGFSIFLKPIVQTRAFVWRGFIPPTDYFFNDIYTPYIVRMAKLAQKEKVGILSIGSELKATIGSRKRWAKVINNVRGHYKGPITYVANHDSYKRVTFWNLLDFISISGYFELLEDHEYDNNNPPDQARTNKLWAAVANDMLAWRKRNKLAAKRILLAEGGAMSKGNGVVYTRPWDYAANAPTDLEAQRKIYEAFLKTFMPPKWSMGVILYDWEADPNAGKTHPTIQTYTPQNKPALKVMTKYFKRGYPSYP